MPDGNVPNAADDIRRLRAKFPRWGILFDPLESVWVAVRGKGTLVAASSPEKLTEQVEAAARGRGRAGMRATRPGRGVPSASSVRDSGCRHEAADKEAVWHRLPTGSFGHIACKWDSGWLTRQLERKPRSGLASGACSPVAAHQGEAGLLREPFTPAAVMTGQRRRGFPLGG